MYLVIEIYNGVCVILMLVTKWKRVRQSRGEGVSVLDIYAQRNRAGIVVGCRTGRDWKGGIRMLGRKEKSRYRGHFM
jgi:hypothetical protein